MFSGSRWFRVVACACACPEKSPSCPGREPSVSPALCRKQWQVQHKSKNRTEPSGSCRQVGSRDGALVGSHTVSPAAGGGGQSPVGDLRGDRAEPPANKPPWGLRQVAAGWRCELFAPWMCMIHRDASFSSPFYLFSPFFSQCLSSGKHKRGKWLSFPLLSPGMHRTAPRGSLRAAEPQGQKNHPGIRCTLSCFPALGLGEKGGPWVVAGTPTPQRGARCCQGVTSGAAACH